MASSRFSATTPKPSARLGSETPRIYTKPLRRLTRKTSLGFSAIDFATDVLNIELFPWQRWLLVHALELHPNGGFRFRNVVVLVARQNGKSTLSQVLALWFMYVYGYDLVLGTAQDLDTAEEVWQGAVDLVTETDDDDEPLRPELFELHKRTVLVNGKKTLELKTGARYKAKAASRRSGRGLSGDLVMLDELREHQSWDAWGAITKTTMARDEAMIWALSNAGDRLSVVLGYLRKLAHAALGDPDGINKGTAAAVPDDDELEVEDDSLGIFEWSAPPGCDIFDRDGWAQANPSLGHKISERTIASAARTDPEAIFRTEVLCQWVDKMEPSVVDLVLWSTLARRVALKAPVWAVEVAADRSASTIAAAWRAEGRPHLEIVENDDGEAWDTDGVEWVVPRLAELATKYQARTVVIDGGSEAASLIAPLEAAGLKVVKLNGAERAAACGGFYDLASTAALSHNGDPALASAVAAARWKDGEGARVFSRRRSAGDIRALYAVTFALFGLSAARDVSLSVW